MITLCIFVGKMWLSTCMLSESKRERERMEGLALSGQKVGKVTIKSDCDVFHQLWKEQQHEIPSLTSNINTCHNLDGEVGCVGYILSWNYILDGKDYVAKTQIIDIDEEKNSVTYKVIGGDLQELYKTFVSNVRVETDGSDNIVTWTIDYEKLSPSVPDPDALLDFAIKTTKDIETHKLQT
ncbi:hypothetical protein LXL04_018537 [Taraxacum kok-saghyz]